jgi:hypothetical protein
MIPPIIRRNVKNPDAQAVNYCFKDAKLEARAATLILTDILRDLPATRTQKVQTEVAGKLPMD